MYNSWTIVRKALNHIIGRIPPKKVFSSWRRSWLTTARKRIYKIFSAQSFIIINIIANKIIRIIPRCPLQIIFSDNCFKIGSPFAVKSIWNIKLASGFNRYFVWICRVPFNFNILIPPGNTVCTFIIINEIRINIILGRNTVYPWCPNKWRISQEIIRIVVFGRF